MRRGAVVTIALQGDYGKPRPALVIQSDFFGAHPSVTILPVTGDLQEAPLFRIRIAPTVSNGLQRPSDLMVDKVQTIPREKVGSVIGHLTQDDMLAVTRSLALFLGMV